MAPRNARAKKAADVKAADGEVQKKGRGKGKNVEETEQEVPEIEINNKNAEPDKKKRGKKANEFNGDVKNSDEAVPPTKRGRKKAIEEPAPEEKASNGENSAEDDNTTDDQNGDHKDEEAAEAPAPTGKGRKKPAKKEEKADKETKPAGRGRKAKQEVGAGDAEEIETEEKKEVEEKPKGKGRGRKVQPKSESQPEEEKTDEAEEVRTKAEAPGKGKKKGAKAAKETTPEVEKEETPEEPVEEKPVEDPKKKEPKGRKAQGKKAQSKEAENNDEEVKEEPASKKRKVSKKEEKAKEESKEEDDDKVEEPVEDTKPVKGKRGQKKAEPAQEPEEETEGGDSGKRRRGAATDKVEIDDSKKKMPLKNKSSTNYEDLDFTNTSKNAQGKEWNFKISSWNVDGIRAWLNKGGLEYIKYEKPDILCLQEVKCSKDKLPEEVANLPGYHAYWLCSDQDGYAGVGIYTAKLAINVQYGLQNEELDSEGRIITAEYEQFYLICTYVPNAGRNLVTLPKRLQWNEEFRKYVKELDKKKPVIICGDMNVAHNEIDLANPKTNKKNAGFTEEERSGMTDLLSDGFVDTFRHMNPDKTGAYTFWTYLKNSRAKNVGWRLDYFIVSERLLPSICDNVIRDGVYGSDHCPMSLFLHLTTANKPKE